MAYNIGDLVKVIVLEKPECKWNSDQNMILQPKEIELNALVYKILGTHAYEVVYILNGILTHQVLLIQPSNESI